MILFDITYIAFHENDYLNHHQNVYDVQIKFNVYDLKLFKLIIVLFHNLPYDCDIEFKRIIILLKY